MAAAAELEPVELLLLPAEAEALSAAPPPPPLPLLLDCASAGLDISCVLHSRRAIETTSGRKISRQLHLAVLLNLIFLM